MKMLFEEYSSTLLQAFICVGILSFFVGIFLSNILNSSNQILSNELSLISLNSDYLVTKMDKFEVKDSLVQLNEKFDYRKYVTAYNSKQNIHLKYINILRL